MFLINESGVPNLRTNLILQNVMQDEIMVLSNSDARVRVIIESFSVYWLYA